MDYFIRAPDFFRKEPLLMKMTFPVTKERIRNHFAYAWWQYVLLICLAIFGWNLLYTTTRYRSPEALKVEWYCQGVVDAQSQKKLDALQSRLEFVEKLLEDCKQNKTEEEKES